MTDSEGLVSKNVTIGSHRTSIRLEPTMWEALKEISARENMSIHMLCTCVNNTKPASTSLTAAVRVFILQYFYHATTELGHEQARHGNLRAEYVLRQRCEKYMEKECDKKISGMIGG